MEIHVPGMLAQIFSAPIWHVNRQDLIIRLRSGWTCEKSNNAAFAILVGILILPRESARVDDRQTLYMCCRHTFQLNWSNQTDYGLSQSIKYHLSSLPDKSVSSSHFYVRITNKKSCTTTTTTTTTHFRPHFRRLSAFPKLHKNALWQTDIPLEASSGSHWIGVEWPTIHS